MGNKLATQTAPLDYYLHDLWGIVSQDVVFQESLGNGRFLKTMKCVHDEGPVVVKVYIKRSASASDLKEQEEKLKEQEGKLKDLREWVRGTKSPNVMPFIQFYNTEKAAYLIRQFFKYNLVDRISTRPFLTAMEKKWLAFQLLNALHKMHLYGIHHGDIKCENVMATSWNWVYLTDLASYKPTYITEDNPSDFYFYFDTSGRSVCYMAPERFRTAASSEAGELNGNMDIFSLGCVIAELFLEGTHIFEYSQLISYRKGAYDPLSVVSRIGDPHIVDLVSAMIKLDPGDRPSAFQCLENWKGKAFPEYFSTLHEYICDLMSLEYDEELARLSQDFPLLMSKLEDAPPGAGGASASHMKQLDDEFSTEADRTARTSSGAAEKSEDAKEEFPRDPMELLVATESFINSLESRLLALDGSPGVSEKVSFSLVIDQPVVATLCAAPPAHTSTTINPSTHAMPSLRETVRSGEDDEVGACAGGQAPVHPAWTAPTQLTLPSTVERPVEGLVVLLPVLAVALRSACCTTQKLRGLGLVGRFARHLNDECRLQRMVPLLLSLLADGSALVRATAISSLTDVLGLVTSFPPLDTQLFPEYILPAVMPLSMDTEELVRVAYAQNVADLAQIAARFLEKSQLFKVDLLVEGQAFPPHQGHLSYDKCLSEIQDQFYHNIVDMLTKDTSIAVKRMLLSEITSIGVFLGRQKTSDYLLPLMITFLNDRNWELRCAFFHNIVGISAFVGMASLELFIYPCIVQALADEEEFVIDRAVNCMACLCELGLFSKPLLLDISHKAAPMLCHPNIWIRYGVVSLMAALGKQLSLPDLFCFLVPAMRPFLLCDITKVTEEILLQCLRSAVPRASFDHACQLARECLLEPKAGGAGGEEDVEERAQQQQQQQQRDRERAAGILSPSSPTPTSPRSAAGVEIGSQRTSDSSSDPLFQQWSKKLRASTAVPADQVDVLLLMFDHIRGRARVLQARKAVDSPSTFFTGSGTDSGSIGLPPDSSKSKVSSTPVPFLITDGAIQIPPNDGLLPTVESMKAVAKPASAAQAAPPLDLGSLKRVDHNLPLPLTGKSLRAWRPKGLLVANLHEHCGAVSALKASADNVFFATASADSHVKVWDCQLLEKNVNNRSRLTYREQKGKLTCLTICECSHSVAAGSDDGSIHIFRVDYTGTRHDDSKKLTSKPKIASAVRYHEQEGGIVDMHHFNTATQSLLVYATTQARIFGWDLRAKSHPWALNNTLRKGLITSLTVDPNNSWLLVGTTRGFYTLWDLRFSVPVLTWRHPDHSGIVRLRHRTGTFVYTATTARNEVWEWDVCTGACMQLFRVSETDEPTPLPPLTPTESSPNAKDYGISELQQQCRSERETPHIYALASPQDAPYLLTGGTDRRIRYWDLNNAASSYTVCGLEKHHHRPKPRYTLHSSNSVSIYQEFPNAADPAYTNMQKDYNKHRHVQPSVVHSDAILDMTYLEVPSSMLVTGARDGVVKVWR